MKKKKTEKRAFAEVRKEERSRWIGRDTANEPQTTERRLSLGFKFIYLILIFFFFF